MRRRTRLYIKIRLLIGKKCQHGGWGCQNLEKLLKYFNEEITSFKKSSTSSWQIIPCWQKAFGKKYKGSLAYAAFRDFGKTTVYQQKAM
jgi:hypothetical protein